MKLSYGDGNVYIDESQDIVGLQIHYNGEIVLENKLSDEFEFILNRGKILIFSLNLDTIPPSSLLFTYEGILKITRCIASGNNGTKIKTFVVNRFLGYWEEQYGKWSENESTWSGIDGTHKVGVDIENPIKSIPLDENKVKEKIKNIKKIRKLQ